MSASVYDSSLYRGLFGDDAVGQLLTDSAETRAMMIVLGALAKVQGAAGVIPEVSAAFLNRAAMEIQIDPGGLADATGTNGVTVPGLVAAFRKGLEAPEHAQYLHWGATSQDIQDTAMMLRMRQVLVLIEERLKTALAGLADLAEANAETPQAARTYGQAAVPSSFGAMVAVWGWPMLRVLERLPALRGDVLAVSLSGAAGTASQLGDDPMALRAAFAEALGLIDPGQSWHADRGRIIELGGWFTNVTQAGAKMGEDLLRTTRSDAAEVRLGGTGASSTMPQKQNPVAPSVLVAMSRSATAQLAALGHPHGDARDGAGWFTEWLTLPLLAAAAGRAAALMAELPMQIEPQPQAMMGHLADPLGLIHAEALSFALAGSMPRPEAQAEVKRLAIAARETGRPLPELVAEVFPETDLRQLEPPRSLGLAPIEARAFAAAARAIL